MTDGERVALQPVDSVVSEVLAGVGPVATERLPVEEAGGRVLAEDVLAPTDLPPETRAAMDGVAVRAADTLSARPDAPTTLRTTGITRAGEASGPTLLTGTCRQIATGAALPAGADAVVRVERITVDGDIVTVTAPVAAGTDVRRSGENAQAGAPLSAAGERLTTPVLVGLAGAGVAEVDVRRQPRITILPTGDEVAQGTTPDALGPALTHLLAADGALATAAAPVPDDADALARALSTAAVVSDVVLTTGGVSVGPADLSLVALREVGAGERVSLALRPGRPFAWGHVGPTLVCCLPGNPGAALAATVLIVRPVVAALLGVAPPQPMALRVAHTVPGDPRRRQLVPGRREGVDGAVVTPGLGSGDIVALGRSTLLVDVPPGDDIPAGTWATAWPLP